MEPVKILIFVGAFLLLLLVGRLLSAASEVHAQELPHNGVPLLRVQPTEDVGSQNEVLTGAEVGFPFTLPPVTEDDKGRFNRPYYTNYYFGKTDLVRGPADPRSFVDDLFLVSQDPGSEQVWETKYVVATPSGLQQLMNQEQYASLYLDDTVVIVSEWNLPVILRTVVDEDLKRFGAAGEEQQSPPAINNLIG
ncbi:MAG TPA: hypothetical protein VFR08_14425 [Candidatus Angelobacter sp.]|nr:hypothetical protein [Candidatus Angelobacter sp.]